MEDASWLTRRFEEEREHLGAVAYRMLGSAAEADDAVQETWLRLNRASTSGAGSEIDNLGGWLTTVVSRVSLDMLRARRRREEPRGRGDEELRPSGGGPATPYRGLAATEQGLDPEQETLLADSVGPALLVVLDTLSPAERLAFVLHDLFALPFDDIAEIVGRSPAAARQLASRARRRVQGRPATGTARADIARQEPIVQAFIAAARCGDFEGLLRVLDPDVVLRVDPVLVPPGVAAEVRGASVVARRAKAFSSPGRPVQAALVNGSVGIIQALRGRLQGAITFDFDAGRDRIVGVDVIADPTRLERLEVAVLEVR